MPSARSFVGRGPELGVLEDALADARRGNGRFVLISGSPGIGKTTLASELVERARPSTTDGTLVVGIGRAWEGAGSPPWWIWREALRPLGVELTLPKTLADDEARFACLETVAETVRDLAANQALVIVLDDLQWADVSSLLAAKLLARSLARTPLLLIGTLREPAPVRPDVDGVLADLRREATILPLTPLGRDEIAAMLAERGLDATHALDLTLGISGGNALFATRLLDDPAARRELALGRRPQVPSGLTSVLVRQLEVLDPRTRTVVEWAAVAGDPIDLPLILVASGLGTEEARAAVERARDAGVLAANADGRTRFAHNLLRGAAYDGVSAAGRSEMHRALARALAGRPDVEARIAEHLYAADPDDTSEEIAEALRAAAGAAVARLAYEQAIMMAERATLADERAGRQGPLAMGMAILAEARLLAGDRDGSQVAAERALAFAKDVVDDPEPYARAALALGLRRTMGLSDASLVGALDEALARLEKGSRDLVALQCAIEARLGSALQPMIDPLRALAMARGAIARARAVGNPALLARTIHDARPAFRLLEPFDERRALDRELLSLAESLRDANLAAHAHGRLFWIAIEGGDAIAADLHLAELERLATQLKIAQHEVAASSARAVRAAMSGDLAEANRILGELEATRERWAASLTMSSPVDLIANTRALIASMHGEDTGAAAAVRTTPAPFRALLEAVFDARLGRIEKATKSLAVGAQAFVAMAERGFLPRVYLAETCVLVRDTTHAASLLTLLEPWSGRHAVATPFPAYFGSVDRLLAGLSALTGDVPRAEALYAVAIAAEESLGAFLHAERTRRERAALIGERFGEAKRGTGESRPPEKSAAALVPVLEHEGDTWVVRFGDEEARLRDAVGLHYLAYLLARPDVAVAAVELFATRALGLVGAPSLPAPSGDAGEILDPKAIASYRARARELREAVEDASANNDRGAMEIAREELELIEAELRTAIGLGGHVRKAGSETERVRVGVTTRIRKAIERLRDRAPLAAHHLATAIKTGSVCIYRTPPRRTS